MNSYPSSILLVLTAVAIQYADCWWFAPVQKDNIKGEAKFNLDGVKGSIKFSQKPGDPSTTLIDYDLTGLKGNTRNWHVHVMPVPDHNPEQVSKNATALTELCDAPNTRGHLNPKGIKKILPPKSAPFDQYEIGDLSGKHGSFQPVTGQADRYKGHLEDNTLPLKGEDGILGRSVVIHKNDGKRWVCASIEELKK